MKTTSPDSRPHLPALDGLRGIAVLLVMLIHFALYLELEEHTAIDRLVNRLALTGFTGVDLFFALSGFLITGILLDTRDRERALVNFYGRRTLRIFPPYYLFLTLYFVVIAPFLPKEIAAPGFSVQAWYWTYLANIRIAIHGWREPVLTHFWSLAVEEQFYLVWPLLVLRASKRRLIQICLAACVLAPLVRIYCWTRGWSEAAYVLTPGRMDGLALGSLVAIASRMDIDPPTILRWARSGGVLALAGIAIIVFSRGEFSHFDPAVYMAGLSLTALGSASLVAACRWLPASSPLVRALSFAPLRAVGRVSYSMYIVHVPILCLMVAAGLSLRPLEGARTPRFLLLLAAGGAATYLSAWLAWHLYEKRLLTLKRYFPDARPKA